MGTRAKNKYLRSLLCLLLLLGASGGVIYWDYIFGNSYLVFDDIGGDTGQQYLWQFHSIVEHLRQGDFSFWDFTNGFGVNMFQYNLFDPSLILVYAAGLIRGTDHMAGSLVYVQILRILAAGAMGYAFFSLFDLSERAKVLSAYIYGLNGFLLVWGQHYQFGMAVFYLPLMLLMAERSWRAGRIKAGLPVAVFFTVCYSTYFSYMCCLTTGIYLLFRAGWEEKGSLGERLWRLVRLCLGMLLGVGMGLGILLPSAYAITGASARLSSSLSLGERLARGLIPYGRTYYVTLAYRLFSANLQNIQYQNYWGVYNWYEVPSVFASVFFVLLGGQFLVLVRRMKLSGRRKTVLCLGAAFTAFALLLPLVSIVYNGLSGPTSRFTFALMPFFCLMIGWMADYFSKGGRPSGVCLCLTVLLAAGIYGFAYLRTGDGSRRFLVLGLGAAALAGGISVWLLGAGRTLKVRRSAFGALLVLAVLDMTLEGRGTVIERTAFSKTDNSAFTEAYSQDVADALAWLRQEDGELYRVEKTYDEEIQCMSALAQGYYGISTYNSTQNGHIRRFVETVRPQLWFQDTNHYRYSQVSMDGELDTFLGIRYLLSRGEAPWGYTYLRSFGDVDVYKCQEETSMARFYSAGKAVAEEELRKAGEEAQRTQDFRALDTLLLENIVLEGKGGEDGLEGSGSVSFAQASGGLLEGTVSAETEGYVLFTIPYEKGWTLRVDGQEEELILADLGFLAAPVEEGTHQITLTYRVPYLREGLLAGAVCWGIYVLHQFVWIRKGRRGV